MPFAAHQPPICPGQARRCCACGEHLALEMELDRQTNPMGICLDCMADAARGSGQAEMALKPGQHEMEALCLG